MSIFKKAKAAFTLAEVVIALTIIGIVAAITVPNVMVNYNAVQARTALKKGISSINQAILKNKTEDGYDCSGTIGFGIDAAAASGSSAIVTQPQSLYHIIEKHLAGKLISSSDVWSIHANFIAMPGPEIASDNTSPHFASVSAEEVAFDTNTTRYYQLNDGMTLIMPPYMGSCGNPRLLSDGVRPIQYINMSNTTCIGFLDVNGRKGPNQVIGCNGLPSGVTTAANDYLITNQGNPGDPLTCEVLEKGITDVYPLLFFNDRVYPATHAAMTVFLEAQKED